MNQKVARTFCRRVGRKLVCLPKTKTALLKGLMEELADLPDERIGSIQNMEANYGKISDVTEELQAGISADEYFQAVRLHKRWEIAVGGLIVLIALIVLTISVIYYLNYPNYVIETIVEG